MDFVFLLGFPGRTMRWAPACSLAFDDDTTVPADLHDFRSKMRMIQVHCDAAAAAAAVDGDGDGGRTVQLKSASAQKSLANYYTRYVCLLRDACVRACVRACVCAWVGGCPSARVCVCVRLRG